MRTGHDRWRRPCVNTATVTVGLDTLNDARSTASGCASVMIQQMTRRLSGDLVIFADSAQIANGCTIPSAGGRAHKVTVVVPGAPGHGSGSINVSNGITADALTILSLQAPGDVTVNGPADALGQLVGGRVLATGKVNLNGTTS